VGAAVDVGFFQVRNHGIDLAKVRAAFAAAEAFFAAGCSKSQVPAAQGRQRRLGEQGASAAIDRHRRPERVLPDHAPAHGRAVAERGRMPGFKQTMLEFEAQCWQVGMRLLSCFAGKLGFDSDFFTQAHDPQQASYQSTLRLLHYYAIDPSMKDKLDLWRAGAHTDFDCLTLLFQQKNQSGLQVCPGKEMDAQEWTSIEPADDVITCNIGDMLMRWSDDQLPSNFHRVKNPLPHEYQGPRYSLAFFCQANRDVMIEGPGKKYPAISADAYLKQRVNANFKAY
jgi:isopenicillin N synthase-like dioxygenase